MYWPDSNRYLRSKNPRRDNTADTARPSGGTRHVLARAGTVTLLHLVAATPRCVSMLIFFFGAQLLVPGVGFADSLQLRFEDLKTQYLKLRNTDIEVKKRSDWEQVAEDMISIARENPGFKGGASALLDAATLYETIFKVKNDEDALERAISTLDELVMKHPHDPLTDDGLLRQADLLINYQKDRRSGELALHKIISDFPDSELVKVARARLAAKDDHEQPTPNASLLFKLPSGSGGVVIDPGHGGEDYGAKGVAGLLEKDVTLAVAFELEKLLKERGIRVTLTRRDDSFVPLASRTKFANEQEADLFVSLHVNASPKGKLSGLEVYYLDNTNDNASQALAERENQVPDGEDSEGDLQFMLSDLIQTGKMEDSIRLARAVESRLAGDLKGIWKPFKRLGVKKAPFYVLVGAHMPCILVEMFFIDHESDGSKLTSPKYRSELAASLSRGIAQFLVKS